MRFDDITEPLDKRLADGLTRLAAVARQADWQEAASAGLSPTQADILRFVANRPEGARLTAAAAQKAGPGMMFSFIIAGFVCAVAAQVYIGSEYEHQSIKNIIQLVDAGMKVGMPTMAVTGVGKDMVRDQRYFSLATRIAAEMGAQIIKTYYVEKGFERIVAGCPVPIVIAGGKKLPEREALEMCWQAIDQGASGVDMGRNIFQSDHPVAMMKAVQAVVHHNETADRAYELYLSEKQ